MKAILESSISISLSFNIIDLFWHFLCAYSSCFILSFLFTFSWMHSIYHWRNTFIRFFSKFIEMAWVWGRFIVPRDRFLIVTIFNLEFLLEHCISESVRVWFQLQRPSEANSIMVFNSIFEFQHSSVTLFSSALINHNKKVRREWHSVCHHHHHYIY